MVGLKYLVVGFHLLVLFLGSLLSPAKSIDENLAPVGSPPPSESPVSTYNVSVQGYVLCRCKLSSYDRKSIVPTPRITFHSRVPGAGVHLKCGSLLVSEGKTEDNGEFSLKAQFPLLADWEAMTRFVEKRCKVYVASTPVPKCTVPESLGPAGGVGLRNVPSWHDGPGYIAFFNADFLYLGPPVCDKE